MRICLYRNHVSQNRDFRHNTIRTTVHKTIHKIPPVLARAVRDLGDLRGELAHIHVQQILQRERVVWAEVEADRVGDLGPVAASQRRVAQRAEEWQPLLELPELVPDLGGGVRGLRHLTLGEEALQLLRCLPELAELAADHLRLHVRIASEEGRPHPQGLQVLLAADERPEPAERIQGSLCVYAVCCCLLCYVFVMFTFVCLSFLA